jgi:hypothetical protein
MQVIKNTMFKGYPHLLNLSTIGKYMLYIFHRFKQIIDVMLIISI